MSSYGNAMREFILKFEIIVQKFYNPGGANTCIISRSHWQNKTPTIYNEFIIMHDGIIIRVLKFDNKVS